MAVQLKIAVLPGDGIGPEIVAQAVRVLRALARDGLAFELAEAPVGGTASDASGDSGPGVAPLTVTRLGVDATWMTNRSIRSCGRHALSGSDTVT